MTTADFFTMATSVFTMIIGFFSNMISTITTNPLLLVPILVAFALSAILFVVGMIKRFGVRGVGRR